MRYRLVVDFESSGEPPPTLWDVTYGAPGLIAFALADIKPAEVMGFTLCKLDSPPITEAVLERGTEIDIEEFLPR